MSSNPNQNHDLFGGRSTATGSQLAGATPQQVLRLIRSENVGPVTFFKLLSHFGSVEAALENAAELSLRGGRKKPITIASKQDAERELEQAEAAGIQILLYGTPDYPALLRSIHDAPPLLMAWGNTQLINKHPLVGMVGARNASANGCRFAQQLAGEIGRAGYTIVSGLARGIDTAAHLGSISTGTIGIIAGGIDTIYPPENTALYERMRVEGLILSEQAFGSAPQPRNFPARNRIISGMCVGTVVAEASLKSGSLITARLAAEQGRDVFAIPGSPMDPRCKGSNQLLREGAILVEEAVDVLEVLRSQRTQRAEEPDSPAFTPAPTAPARLPSQREMDAARTMVLEKLGPEAVLVDELLTQSLLTPGILFTILLELELAGRLHRYPGNRVSLAV